MSYMKFILFSTIVMMVFSKGTVFKIPENSKKISYVVNSNDEFTFQVSGNPTTGYSWIINNAELFEEGNSLVLVSSNFKTDSHPKGMVGVGGVYNFHFKTAKTIIKEHIVILAYKRIWEETPIKTIEVVVKIQ